MEYYFEVVTDIRGMDHVLVKARDVIEAGKIVVEVLSERGYMASDESIVEITRTNITKVIE